MKNIFGTRAQTTYFRCKDPDHRAENETFKEAIVIRLVCASFESCHYCCSHNRHYQHFVIIYLFSLCSLSTSFFHVLHRSIWGRGYATEAAGERLGYGLEDLGIKLIVGLTYADHHASRRIVEKIGMTYEGRVHDYSRDLVQYYAIKKEGTP